MASARTNAPDPVTDVTVMPNGRNGWPPRRSTPTPSALPARQVSRHVTPVFLALGLSANGATAFWGLISLFNSFVIYLTIVGAYYLLPPSSSSISWSS